MADVLIEFVNELIGSDGTRYEARACGRKREDESERSRRPARPERLILELRVTG